MKSVRDFWGERSEKYGRKIEGVLPKSFPKVLNNYLDRWMYEGIKKEIPKNASLNILDLGCGYGRLSKKILSDFPKTRVYGVDVAREYVDIYNQDLAPRGKAYLSDIRRLPFKDSYFDQVFMVTTLMYLVTKKDQLKALNEMFRVLKNGGKFIIIERNPKGHSIVTLGGLIEKIRGGRFKEITSVSFKKEYLEYLIKASGGSIKKERGIGIFSIFFHSLFVISLISEVFAEKLLRLVRVLDEESGKLLTLSLYILYSGEKK